MKCDQTGKECHTSAGVAKAHLKSLKERFGSYDGEIYHCRFCNCWHVGRPDVGRPKPVHKNKYKQG